MSIKKIFKTPSERFVITGSIVKVQASTEDVILAGSSVEALDKDGVDVSTEILDQATLAVVDIPNRSDGTNSALAIRVRAGSNGASPYAIKFKILTDAGNLFVVDTRLTVKA